MFPPSPSAVYRLYHCSASCNFNAFPTDAGGLQRETATAIVIRFVRSGDVDPEDVLIVDNDDPAGPDVEYVVSGWSHLLEDEAEPESAEEKVEEEEEEEHVSESEL